MAQHNPTQPPAFPEGDAMRQQVAGRRRRGVFWQTLFILATMIGIIALLALLYNIINGAFGYVAIQNKIEPAALVAAHNAKLLQANPNAAIVDQPLAQLPKEALIAILQENVSKGLMRRLENDQPFAERSQENVYNLVLERVVEPQVVRSWTLRDSLFARATIAAEAAEIPNGELIFRSWLTPNFLTNSQSPLPQQSGVRTAILGSLWVILITILFSLPIGVGAAIYLEEYADDNRLNRLIETNINNLAGVPSIIYGLLGLAVFVRIMEPLTSGSLFGVADPTTANGRTVLSAGLTLGLLILPLIIINAREAIRAVPASLRQASFGLGATQWQTIWHHVLPNAIPGILTGTILAISRALGETAPLVVIGASTFIVVDPDGPFSKFTTLPIQIYQWTARPQDEFRNIAAAAIVVLLALLLTLNATAVLLRNRYTRRI
ncbi:MAG: phosphate ABC transporter permease PstA [Caldilinea sp. CFX5]|nr:phosphate ABC transporter permease PstA [Caldilinea sp. CFX5]